MAPFDSPAARSGSQFDSPAARSGSRLLEEGAVVETSGSTGSPKRVVLSGAAFRASAAAATEALGAPGDWVLTLPTDYVAGMNVLARAAHMGTEVVRAVGGPSFSAMGFAAVVLGRDPGVPLYTSLVPIQLQRLLDSVPGLDALRTFSRILLGGQAPDPALLRRARQEGLPVTITYGASETCGGVIWDGRPIGDAAYRLIDGVVHLGGPTLADGYEGDAERTAEAFPVIDGVRWHRTRDFGEERSGRLFVLGRLDDVIVSGGLKVSLTEVEFAARSFGLVDAVAVAVERQGWGQAPAVVATGAADLDALREHVEANLGPAARPVAFRRVERMPLLASGKPDRAAIRALF
ncbi:MAG: AMP-binding protein [Microbacteriaceae bacterium]|nr:AMP-binding protein [Microbacteriaceae bacterium]